MDVLQITLGKPFGRNNGREWNRGLRGMGRGTAPGQALQEVRSGLSPAKGGEGCVCHGQEQPEQELGEMARCLCQGECTHQCPQGMRPHLQIPPPRGPILA